MPLMRWLTMTRQTLSFAAVLGLSSLLMAGLGGCEEKSGLEKAADDASKNVGQAADDAAEKVDEAAEELEDAADDAAEKMGNP
jgi:fructoselysine-6-P-deglycase FrlB-like protein